MIFSKLTKDELSEYFQITLSIVGTKGALKEKGEQAYGIFNKKELMQHLEDIIPDTEFGYSVLSATKDDECGV